MLVTYIAKSTAHPPKVEKEDANLRSQTQPEEDEFDDGRGGSQSDRRPKKAEATRRPENGTAEEAPEGEYGNCQQLQTMRHSWHNVKRD